MQFLPLVWYIVSLELVAKVKLASVAVMIKCEQRISKANGIGVDVPMISIMVPSLAKSLLIRLKIQANQKEL